ncbi:hypothetical protein RB595_001231 [Gaeumannomyces hyphopodioides]
MAPKSTCSTRPSTLLAQAVLLMASSVSALTLSDFQSIASSSVPLGCILAYNNSPLTGCSQSDFTAGSGCASRCVRSLGLVQSTLQVVCADAPVPTGSVLRAALQGSLVDTLCGRGLQPPRTTSTRLILPPSTSSLSPPPAVTSTRRIPPSSQPPLSSTSVSTSASTSITTARGPSSLTPVPVTTVIPPPPSSKSSENGTPGTPLPTGTPAPTTSTRGPEETATAPPQSPGQGGQRGGGSPFDPAVVAGAQQALPTNPMAVLAWASAVGLLIMEGVVL